MNNLKLEIENYLIKNFNKIKINSKDVIKGDVFVALKGKNNHGNKYINNVLNKKVKYIITDRKYNSYLDKKILKVNNSLNFLKDIAIKKRNQFTIR